MTDFVYQERSPEPWERRAKQNYKTNHTFRTKVAKGAKPRKKRATTDLAVAPQRMNGMCRCRNRSRFLSQFAECHLQRRCCVF